MFALWTMGRFPNYTWRRRLLRPRWQFEQLAALFVPGMYQPCGQAQDDDIEKTADHKAKQSGERGEGARVADQIHHVRLDLGRGNQPTTAASLKIGRYMPTTRPPTIVPMITMMNGSSRLASASTALLTSCS